MKLIPVIKIAKNENIEKKKMKNYNTMIELYLAPLRHYVYNSNILLKISQYTIVENNSNIVLKLCQCMIQNITETLLMCGNRKQQ